MRASGFRLSAALLLLAPAVLRAQAPAGRLIREARAQVEARHLDSADVLLRAALDPTAHASPDERENALVWRGIAAFMRGDDTLTRVAFRQALELDSNLTVAGLATIAPRLADIFAEEKGAPSRRNAVYVASNVDDPPRRVTGPPVAYPPELLRRHPAGTVAAWAVIDTLGRAEPASLRIEDAADSALIDPVERMVLASQFSPGRHRGRLVRVLVLMRIPVQPPRLVATELVAGARAQLAARHSDSAFTLLALAMDTALTHATTGEQTYALLVRGVAWSRTGRDSLASVDFAAALASYQGLLDHGVTLAPLLRRLADSVRQTRRGGVVGTMATPTAVGEGEVDDPPALRSHPQLRYPPAMAAVGAAGTVVVDATLEPTGRVDPSSVRIVQSANPGFDDEVRRVVRAAVYRPALRQGRPLRVVIRQAITFAGH